MKCPRCKTEMKDLGNKLVCPKCSFEVIKESGKTPNLQPINDAVSSQKMPDFPMNEDTALL